MATAPRPVPVEVELKYAVRDRAALVRLLDAEWLADLAAGPWRTQEVEDRYLETADGALARAGFAARLRRTAGSWTLTLKGRTRGEGRGGTLFRRVELEGPATGDLEPTAWPPGEARERLLALTAGAPLQERFVLRQRREERDLRGVAGWAELSLDHVSVLVGERLLGEREFLEVELRGGEEGLLHRLAEVLEASGEVIAEGRSKEALAMRLVAEAGVGDPAAVQAGSEEPHEPAAEGRAAASTTRARPTTEAAASPLRSEDPLELGEGSEPAAAPEPGQAPGSAARPREGKARRRGAGEAPRVRLEVGHSPGVDADDPLAEAGRKVLRFHLARMLAREAGTRAGTDSEEVHGMRVATRRMRAAWRVFGDAYRRGPEKRYLKELRTVAAALGAVRDLDVLIEGLEAYLAGLEPQERAALTPLRDAWGARRAQARRRLEAVLDGPAYQRFVADYLAFVTTEGAGAARVAATEPHRVRDTAPSRIWLAYEQLRAYETGLRWADVATLHAMRIAAKRLRYTLESFREAIGPETRSLIPRVVAIQDHLGALHDADVAAGLAREFLVASAAGLAPASIEAVGRYLAAREREVVRLRRGLAAVWRPVASEPFRRSLGRCVSSL